MMGIIKSFFSEIWKIIKFVYQDLVTDVKCLIDIIKKISKGEEILSSEKKEILKRELKTITPSNFIKESWPWIIVVIFAFLCGWIVAAKYYQIICNNFIIENYINPEIIKNLPSNITPINISNISGLSK